MKLICFLFLVLFLLSCKKTRVVIQASDLVTGNGSYSAGMKFEVVEKSTPLFDTKVKTIEEGFLDENGWASFNLKMKNNKQYVVGVERPDSICHGKSNFLMNYLEYEKNNIITINYTQCTYLKLKINNINCSGESDKLRLSLYDDIGVLDSLEFTQYDGCINYETSGSFNGSPNGYRMISHGILHYKWEVTRNGNTTTYYDSKYYDIGQRYTYEINY